MSKEEKQKVKDLIEKAKQMPENAKDYLRGYMQGIVDGKKDADNSPGNWRD